SVSLAERFSACPYLPSVPTRRSSDLHQLAWPTMAMGWMLSILQRGRASMQRLNELFAVEPAIMSAPDAAPLPDLRGELTLRGVRDRKSTRLNSSHQIISYAVFCLKKK